MNTASHDSTSAEPKKIKVLHIGNVANYAYNIAKNLQTSRIESTVVNWDYYHINSRPEWEEVEIKTETIGDPFFPHIEYADGSDFVLPDWYVSGPRNICIGYLIAENTGDKFASKIMKRYLDWALANSDKLKDRKNHPSKFVESALSFYINSKWNEKRSVLGIIYRVFRRVAIFFLRIPIRILNRYFFRGIFNALSNIGGQIGMLERDVRSLSETVKTLDSSTKALHETLQDTEERHEDVKDTFDSPYVNASREITKEVELIHDIDSPIFFDTEEPEAPEEEPEESVEIVKFDDLVGNLWSDYEAFFPTRNFNEDSIAQFENISKTMRTLLEHYDVIIGYALEGIYPLTAGKKYLAYEFGTIRNIPFSYDIQGMIGFSVYRNAARTIVTNCDNNVAADKLGLDYFFLPHIVSENGLPSEEEAARFRQGLIDEHGGDFFVFHPSRQHWNRKRDSSWEKGNDHFLRGFADFVLKENSSARCICVDWGESAQASKALVARLGVERNIVWIKPQTHISMMRYIAACDVVADQFNVTTFGGIPPKAFFAGKPVISAFDDDMHRWCFKELPPFIDARTASEISRALKLCCKDTEFYESKSRAARSWYDNYNSSGVIAGILEEEILKL